MSKNINTTRRYTHCKVCDTELFLTALEGLAKINPAHSHWMRNFRACSLRISHWTSGIFFPPRAWQQ